jgi:hypothetical protein
MKSTNSAEPDIIEMSRMYRFERDQRIILEKQIAALTFESITGPFSERFEQFIEALPSCQMRSNLRWIQSNFCKTHQEVISMSNGACPYCEAAAPAQPVPPSEQCECRGNYRQYYNQHGVTCCDNCNRPIFAAPAPVLTQPSAEQVCPKCGSSIISTSHGLYCPKPTCKWGWEVEMDGSPLQPPERPVLPVTPKESLQEARSDGWEDADDAAHAYLDSHGAPPANGRGLYLRLDEILAARASSPAVPNEFTHFLETVAWNKGCSREYLSELALKLMRAPAVAGRTQGEDESWMTLAAFELVKHADNGKAIGSWQFILNTLKAAKLAEQRKSDRLELPPKIRVEPVYYVANFDGSHSIADPQPSLQLQEWYQFNARRNARIIRRMRESAREAPLDDLIEALKTIADAPTHITYEGIFVSTNVKDVARKELRAERDEASPEAPAAKDEKCGQPAAPFIPRWGMSFACVLPKGHVVGEHKQGGSCVVHGDYVGDKCPNWPMCTNPAPAAPKEK